MTELTHLHQDGNHIKWFLKFGDGDGETPTGRYVTHNPDYE